MAHQPTEKCPFDCALSLAPLIDFWESVPGKHAATGYAAHETIQEIRRDAPELLTPITDLDSITRYRTLLDVLMTVVIPQATWDHVSMAALLPCQLQSFYATPAFGELLPPSGTLEELLNVDAATLGWYQTVRAYIEILQQVYHLQIDFEYPLIATMRDPHSKLARHFQLYFDRRFIRVHTHGTPPRLTPQAQQRVLTNFTDTQLLRELLPPEYFSLEGFTVCNAVDVTRQEVLSLIKRDLIEQPSMVSLTCFGSLLEQLRTFFRRPQLAVALVAFRGKQALRLTCEQPIQYECIFADSIHYDLSALQQSVYARLFEHHEWSFIDDLSTQGGQTPIEEACRVAGIRSLLIAPLLYQETLIGAVELGSPAVGDLHMAEAFKLRDALPLLSMLIKRGLDELDNKLQTVIRQECTAIHPAVMWRFELASVPYILNRHDGLPAEMESIVFNDVYPLYAVSDIRSSSTHRSQAIQADLIEHLLMAHGIIRAAYQAKALPVLDEVDYRLTKHLQHIEAGLHSGDEVTVVEFLHREVEPLFPTLTSFSTAVLEQIQHYNATIQPPHHTIYRRRKDFEDSVMLINETIDTYLTEEDAKAQTMFPHYFEKHKTDGVEFGIYVGASLVEDNTFSDMYLRNIRLWQCLVLCEIVQRMAELRNHLKVPMDTAHLILVHNTPLNIRFLFDEKRFNVDGAYDIRYEIMKKRIDKAVIRNTSERLTQPGKIAIVYSHQHEAEEYQEYIDYLQTRGYLEAGVEQVELEDLQGIHGLRALRVTVALPPPGTTRGIDLAGIHASMQALAEPGKPPPDLSSTPGPS